MIPVLVQLRAIMAGRLPPGYPTDLPAFLHLVLKAIQMSDAKIQPSGALGAGGSYLMIEIPIGIKQEQ